MFLVVGLGNPGRHYQLTRHNVGFLCADYLAELLRVDFVSSKWQSEVARGVVEGRQVILAKPQTYMNRSGSAVQALGAFYKIPPDKIIVIHDDLDMAPGCLKVVVNRGAGGHNGVRSLISHLGCQSFIRIKIGIGKPIDGLDVESYVLRELSADEHVMLGHMQKNVADAVSLIITKGVEAAMNRINCLKRLVVDNTP
ncbi:MAG: aminoacyl-tRNA hydrolase [Thermodesulfobacteriota bacterium]